MATVIVSGLAEAPRRLEVARALGANHTIEADRDDVVAEVMAITEGKGVDVVVDLTPGATEPVTIAVEAAAKRGIVILAGSKHGRPIPGLKSDTFVRKELTVRGVRGRDYRSVELAFSVIGSGRYPLEQLSTHSFGLDEVDRALRVMGEHSDPTAIHINVIPD